MKCWRCGFRDRIRCLIYELGGRRAGWEGVRVFFSCLRWVIRGVEWPFWQRFGCVVLMRLGLGYGYEYEQSESLPVAC